MHGSELARMHGALRPVAARRARSVAFVIRCGARAGAPWRWWGAKLGTVTQRRDATHSKGSKHSTAAQRGPNESSYRTSTRYHQTKVKHTHAKHSQPIQRPYEEQTEAYHSKTNRYKVTHVRHWKSTYMKDTTLTPRIRTTRQC